MMHIALELFLAYAVKRLAVAHCTKRRHRKHLRLAAREYCASVRPRKYPNLAPYRTYLLICTAVRTYTLVDYLFAYDFLCKAV